MIIYTEEKFIIGALEDMLSNIHGVMANANGLLPDSDQLNSMFPKADITSFVIVKCQQMLHSAVELIKLC